MPVKKHRLRFKLYHDCFTGFDAVEWLHELLKANQNFSPDVSLFGPTCIISTSFLN